MQTCDLRSKGTLARMVGPSTSASRNVNHSSASTALKLSAGLHNLPVHSWHGSVVFAQIGVNKVYNMCEMGA